MFYALRGAISEFEKAKITERMSRGRREKARQGRVLRDFKIYGYNFEPQEEQLVINEAEAAVVKDIFFWFLNPKPGMRGIAGIAAALSQAKIPTKRRAAKWHRQVVRQILKNPTYLGEFYQNKWDTTGAKVRLRPRRDWILIPCPAIIEPEVFMQAQLLLSQARRRYSGRESNFLLSGLLTCARCLLPLRGKGAAYVEEKAGGCGLILDKKSTETAVWDWFWALLKQSGGQEAPEPKLTLSSRRELLRILIREIQVGEQQATVFTF